MRDSEVYTNPTQAVRYQAHSTLRPGVSVTRRGELPLGYSLNISTDPPSTPLYTAPLGLGTVAFVVVACDQASVVTYPLIAQGATVPT